MFSLRTPALRHVTLCLMAGVLGGTLRAADPGPEIAMQRALDQPITLNLEKVELSEAFKQIAAIAKITLQIDPACYDLLPYGATTRVSVNFGQSKLRDALDTVLNPLGLEEGVAGASVLIRPSTPLIHIGRRADWEELKLMKELYSSSDLKLNAGGGGGGGGQFNLVDAIRTAMDGRKDLVVMLPVETAGAGAKGGAEGGALAAAHDKAIAQISKQLPMSAYRALEMYCQLTNQVWFVEAGPLFGGETGGTVRIMSPRQWIERQLERPMSASYTDVPLEVVVADLAHASGIHFVPEPGLFLNPLVQTVRLTANNAPVRQTLESLAAGTRVAYDVRDDSIYLHYAAEPGNQPQRTDNIVGRISVPVGPEGLMMEMFIRESDLPGELNDLRKKHVQEAVDGLKKQWNGGVNGAGGGHAVAQSAPPVPAMMTPTPGPATAPATQASK